MATDGDSYYQRNECSNSDLTALELLFSTRDFVRDATEAYRFGRLIDYMITENFRVNYFKKTAAGEQYNAEEFKAASNMKKSFFRDPFCSKLAQNGLGQTIFIEPHFKIEYRGFEFELPFRIKYDLFMKLMGWGADIKSTTATTLDQFIAAIKYFNYDRQRAVYMDISGAPKDVLIGISKTAPYKIFKVPITRESELYKTGKEKYQALAFRYWQLFNDF
jgi:hypothetical protein